MKRVVANIPDGDAGIDATVAAMWRLISRDVTDPLIVKTVKNLKAKSCEDSAKNVYKYVIKNFKYKNDPEGIELVTAPVNMVNRNNPRGDCDDLVTVLVCLLAAANVPVRIKTIAWRRHEYTHVICEYNCSGTWIPLDPVRGSNGFGNTITKTIRTKTYSDPVMSRPLVTLEDNFVPRPCGCRGSRGGNVNKNVINIVNTIPAGGTYVDKLPQSNSYISSQPKVVYYPLVQKEKVPVNRDVYIKEAVPVPVTKIIPMPSRTIDNPNTTTYKEFY